MGKNKFWEKFENFSKKYLFNKKVFLPVILGIFLFIIILGIIAYTNEKRTDKIQEVYINAFNKLKPVSDKMDNLNKERIGLAIKELEKTIDLPGNSSEKYIAYLNLADLYLKMNQKETALKYLSKAEEAPSDFLIKPMSMIMTGRIYMEDGKIDEAIEKFNYIIKKYEGYFKDTALYYRGICYEMKNDINMAISSYKMITENSIYNFEAKKNIEVIERLKNLEVK